MSGYFAVINDGIVENVIVATADFTIDGYTLVEYDRDKKFCEPGMYYNTSDGLFYDDAEFTKINGSAK